MLFTVDTGHPTFSKTKRYASRYFVESFCGQSPISGY